MIKTKRIYENINNDDGIRILVDRYWPRGISQNDAHLSLWIQDIAPSLGLFKWYSHEPKRWYDFKKRYFSELSNKKSFVKLLRGMSRATIVTLLYSSKDLEHNNAVALMEYLQKKKSKYPN